MEQEKPTINQEQKPTIDSFRRVLEQASRWVGYSRTLHRVDSTDVVLVHGDVRVHVVYRDSVTGELYGHNFNIPESAFSEEGVSYD